jgi:hypothetical protein
MEPTAINHITVTPELFQESFSTVFVKRKQQTLLICGIVFTLAGVIFLLIQHFFQKLIVLGAPVIVMGCFVIGWSFWLPVSERKKKYKALCRKNGGEPVKRTVEFFETGLSVHTEDEFPVEIDYSEVKEVKETEHLAILLCENRMGVLLDKAGFETGTLKLVKELVERFSSSDTTEE